MVRELTFKMNPSRLTNPRTNKPLLEAPAGTRGCVFRAGCEWHSALMALPPDKRICTLGWREVKVSEVRLTIIDRVTERDLELQVVPSWRTPEGAEAGLLEEYGDLFGRTITVIYFELL